MQANPLLCLTKSKLWLLKWCWESGRNSSAAEAAPADHLAKSILPAWLRPSTSLFHKVRERLRKVPQRLLCAHRAGDSAGGNRESQLHDPITFRVFHVETFYSAARGAQISKKALPFLPFGPFEKAFLFRFAKEAGTYVSTSTGGRNSETADEL